METIHRPIMTTSN